MSINVPLSPNYVENTCNVIYERSTALTKFQPSDMTQHRVFIDDISPGRHTIFADLRAQLVNVVDKNESCEASSKTCSADDAENEHMYSILAKSLTLFYYKKQEEI